MRSDKHADIPVRDVRQGILRVKIAYAPDRRKFRDRKISRDPCLHIKMHRTAAISLESDQGLVHRQDTQPFLLGIMDERNLGRKNRHIILDP